MPEIIDTFGVPEYFATTTRIESAGGGNVRIFNCTLRNGILIPVCTVVFPMACVLKIVADTREFAQQVIVLDMEGGTAH